MKRNSKFLLLLALIMSGIIGVYLISCVGDTITEPPPVVEDKVIGSVHGVVTDDIYNTPLPGVAVTWVNNGETHTVTTDTSGYFMTTGVLGSGDYEFTFSVNAYTVLRAYATIPTVTYVRGQDPDAPAGDMPWSETLDVDLFPLNASLTGEIFTALPAPGKEIDDPMAADSVYLRAAETLKVWILFDYLYIYCETGPEADEGKEETPEMAANGIAIPLNISPDRYFEITDANGVYLFDGLPAVTGGRLLLYSEPFTRGETTYVAETLYVSLLPNVTVTVPNIYADIAGDPAQVMNTNFETGKFELVDDLIIAFSKEMDTATVRVTLTQCDENCNNCTTDLSFSFSWSDGNRLLTIDPTYALIPDLCYQIEVTGTATDGNPLASFTRTFEAIDGMRFVSTNLDDYSGTPGSFLDFPLDSDIILCFDMVPDLTNPNTSIRLIDTLSGQQIDLSSSVSGNCVVIDPANPLESNHTYRLYFEICSDLSVDDCVHDSEVLPGGAPLVFSVECTEVVPAQVTEFELVSPDIDDVDWNTTWLTFRWNTVLYADEYQIYAKDNHENTDFTKVATVSAADYVTWQEGSVDFSDPANWQFDLYQDDILCNGNPLITPFSGGNAITFQVRAVNNCHGGQYGPFSSSETLEDEVAPVFTLSQTGNADQVGKAGVQITIDITGTFDDPTCVNYWIEYAESADPTFAFIEGGGSLDPAPSPVTWDWEKEIRDGWATFTVPAATAAAGDTMFVTICDNSNNCGTASLRLLPNIMFVVPTADSGIEAGVSRKVEWTVDNADDANILLMDAWLSIDGGANWDYSVMGIAIPDFVTTPASTMEFLVNSDVNWDTVMIDGNAQIRLRDSDGGLDWLSELFTISGIMMTGPPEDYSPSATDTVFDRAGTDSVTVPLTWDFVGINDVIIQYYPGAAPPVDLADWIDDETIANTGSYDWYPPLWSPDPGTDPSETYECWVRVADADLNMEDIGNNRDKRPADYNEFSFWVFHDTIRFFAPALDQDVTGGQLSFNVRWRNFLDENQIPQIATLGSILKIHYAVVPYGDPPFDPADFDESDWVLIEDPADNDCSNPWDVPGDTATDQAFIRIQDAAGGNYYSPAFTITGLIVTRPNLNDDWDVGTAENIEWTNVGDFGDNSELVDIEYWDCELGSWETIVEDVLASLGFWPWNTVWNVPCVGDSIRVISDDGTILDESDAFTISGFKILTPTAADTLWVGDNYQVTWSTIGVPDDADDIFIDYSAGSAPPVGPWIEADPTGNNPISNTPIGFAMIVPGVAPVGDPENDFFLRISAYNAGPIAPADTSVKLVVATPDIEVLEPSAGDEFWMDQDIITIEWTSIGLGTPEQVTIELYYNPGTGFEKHPNSPDLTVPSMSGMTNTVDWPVPANLDIQDIDVMFRISGPDIRLNFPVLVIGWSDQFIIRL